MAMWNNQMVTSIFDHSSRCFFFKQQPGVFDHQRDDATRPIMARLPGDFSRHFQLDDRCLSDGLEKALTYEGRRGRRSEGIVLNFGSDAFVT